MHKLAIAIALAQLACGGAGAPAARTRPPAHDPAPDGAAATMAEQAAAGVSNRALADLLVRHWDWTLSQSPVWATTLGDHRFDDRLGDASQEGVDRERAQLRAFFTEASSMPIDGLSAADRTTLALFLSEMHSRIASEVCDFHLWSISARGNPVVEFNTLPDDHEIVTVEDGRAFVARLRQIPGYVDDVIANLRRGAAAGMFTNAESLRRTTELIKGQLDKPVDQWPLMKAIADVAALEGWSEEQRAEFGGSVSGLVSDQIAPAYARLHALLAEELVPGGRVGAAVGVHALPQGDACYQARIRHHTGLQRSAQELHQLGLTEIARINAEMQALGKKLFGTDELNAIIDRLRSDETLYYRSKKEIVDKARQSLARARAAIPDYFGILPATDCVVVEIPDYEAPYTTIAYYREPHSDGTKPGEYFINTYKPEVRPRFEMEVLAYHESIPGHHLQIAISQERGALPAFRRFGGSTAFVEGWALYTERLSEEMGLYTSDLDRMGVLSYDAWRASRLVVDTGIHALGWTREQAETFMFEHTALTRENIVNEVDRYISWPGQALAYKVGQLEILRMRAQAEKALGDRFDIKGFHDAVLSRGAVTLPVLADQVSAWISERGAAATE